MKKKHGFHNKSISIIITVGFAVVTGLILLFLDYFNIPSKLGLSINMLNYDFWGIYFGNGVVITLFVVTFFLFDKKNLQKEKLADYAGAVLLLDTYIGCDAFLKIIQSILATKEKVQPKVSDYIYNGPFENDDKIFDLLQSGHISEGFFEQYSYIKKQYQVLVYTATDMKGRQELSSKLLNDIMQQIKEEKEKLQLYKESLK